MNEDRALRLGLIASLLLNGVAISIVGYAGTFKPVKAAVVVAPKPHPTRLVEIAMLSQDKTLLNKPSQDKLSQSKETGAKGTGDKGTESSGGKAADGPLSDSTTGPMGKLNTGGLAKEPAHTPKEPPKPPVLSAQAKKNAAAVAAKNAAATNSQKPGGKIDAHPKLDINRGTVHLKRPGPMVTGGYHGVIDLRNVKMTAHLVADDKNPGSLKPNKFIGKSHIKVIGKPEPGGAKCIPTGGHTIYGSDVTILLGKGIKTTGTKYCVPGAGGIPGSQSSGGGSGQALSQGTKKGSGTGKDGKGLGDDSDGATQEALALRQQQMATGPVRELNHGGGAGSGSGGGGVSPKSGYDINLGDAPSRALHLPETHNDPTDRIPGVWVPQDQRKLVDSPKAHRGSSAPKGSPEGTDPKQKPFELAPASVGSHSTRGTIAWAPDSPRADKHKASRRVKGNGKKDGGGDGSGLYGVYYFGANFEHEVFRRADKNIDFDWSDTPVSPRLSNLQPFSVRWTGKIRPRYSEVYTLYAASDDGARLWIDGRLIISNWTVHAPTEDTAQIALTVGREYTIKLEYCENGMPPAVMKLYWESRSQRKEYVPQSCLIYPEPK